MKHNGICQKQKYYTGNCICGELREQRDEIIQLVKAIHYPKTDLPESLITYSYCACGAMEVFLDVDGYNSIGPARYPCATMRALEAL